VSDIQIEARGNGQYFLAGSLTFANVPNVYAEGNALFDSDTAALTLDLQGIERTDSAGLALLLEWLRNAQQKNKTIRFRNIPPQLQSMIRLSGLDDILSLN
jgi:phospholipid transport system transporter-binding protein